VAGCDAQVSTLLSGSAALRVQPPLTCQRGGSTCNSALILFLTETLEQVEKLKQS